MGVKQLNQLILIIALSISMISCSKNTTTENSKNSQTQSVTLLDATIYPHSEDFKQRTHGTHYLEDRTLCSRCHGSEKIKGTSNVTCTQCHSLYPHPTNWAIPTSHGEKFLTLSKEEKSQCFKCHGQKEKKSDNAMAVACNSCHKSYPHSNDFEMGDDNHAEMARSYQGHCESCHTDFKANMPTSENGCRDCHGVKRRLKIFWEKIETPPAEPIPTPSEEPTTTPNEQKSEQSNLFKKTQNRAISSKTLNKSVKKKSNN